MASKTVQIVISITALVFFCVAIVIGTAYFKLHGGGGKAVVFVIVFSICSSLLRRLAIRLKLFDPELSALSAMQVTGIGKLSGAVAWIAAIFAFLVGLGGAMKGDGWGAAAFIAWPAAFLLFWIGRRATK
ncbi:MAG: hypothetical protein ACAH83_07230 [Alphaproteobacteria bacterium]